MTYHKHPPGTAGVGAETVVELARHSPAHLIFTGRNAKSAESTIARCTSAAPDIRVSFVPCDLADLASVRTAADRLLADTSRLDVVVCCAGIMAKPPALSKDGYELQFATNHLGHALLTLKLLPLIERTAAAGNPARIVMVTSTGWRGAPRGGIVFDRLRTTQDMPLGRWLRYGQSKLANMLWARELAARYPSILSFSLTPGVVETGLVTDLGFADKVLVYVPNVGRLLTVQQGAYNLLWAVGAEAGSVKRGAFYEPVGRLSSMENKASRDPTLGGRLWEWTEEQLKPFL
jgi:NAD(P)-dependent dehydrogenase (short-subunit alcohol dehydrogenase family)